MAELWTAFLSHQNPEDGEERDWATKYHELEEAILRQMNECA
jgi:hypothetical protein